MQGNIEKATVMNPGDTASQSILSTPTMIIDGDRMVRPEELRECMMNLTACADGGNTGAKEVSACKSIALYRPMEIFMKELVKEALRGGEIILSFDQENNRRALNETVEKVRKMMEKDSLVESSTKMVRLNNKVRERVMKPQKNVY